MKLELNNDHPLTDEELSPLLSKIQGNILRDHGRDYSVHIFLRFIKDPTNVRKWIQKFSKEVTSAQDQRELARTYRQFRDAGNLRTYTAEKEKPFVNFFLSAAGYRKLGFNGSQMPQDLKFFNGMKGSRESLGDSYSDWDDNYDDLDAMILLAHDNWCGHSTKDNPNLMQLASYWEEQAKPIASFSFMEKGEVMYDRPRTHRGKKPVEHFGFIDGISNPLFLESDFKHPRDPRDLYGNEEVLQRHRYDPFASLSLVLVPDPNAEGSYGSYLVFRKLRQRVDEFRKKVKRLTDQLENKREGFAGALILGRFGDGTPLTLSQSGYGSPYEPKNHNYNDFHYGHGGAPQLDADTGMRCPFHAHIRKANPRKYEEARKDDSDSIRPLDPLAIARKKERDHRILRRGITYGSEFQERYPENHELDGVPTFMNDPQGEVGLLFMCFQSDVGKQFEYIQRQLNFTNAGLGLDPIAGQQEKEKGMPQEQRWPVKWLPKWDSFAVTNRTEFRFQDVVTLRGGEYFFAPSMSFLASLADDSYKEQI